VLDMTCALSNPFRGRPGQNGRHLTRCHRPTYSQPSRATPHVGMRVPSSGRSPTRICNFSCPHSNCKGSIQPFESSVWETSLVSFFYDNIVLSLS